MTQKQKSFIMDKGATFSLDRVYRYSLWRIWDASKGYAAFVCLNPSTADETKNDPTVRRCINYSKQWGYGGMKMLNIFAYRSTEPKKLYEITDPVGPVNDMYLKNESDHAGITIVAWGKHGNFLDRGKSVLLILNNPHFLALNKDRTPKHPLYLKKSLKPIRM